MLESECSVNETCCDGKCVQGRSCLGQTCKLNSDCSSSQSCCSWTCKSGRNCIGESCSSESDCQGEEKCCRGTCSKGYCVDNSTIIGLAVCGGFCVICIAIISFARCRSRRRQELMELNSNIALAPVTQSNPLYQPQGPPSDQQLTPNCTQSDQPPPYTATPTGESDGLYAPQNSFAAASRKYCMLVSYNDE